jgi:hypothetical protein
MIKSITVFKNIEDVNALLKHYVEVIFPIMHKIPGVIGTVVTSVTQVTPDVAQDLDGVQLIMETHFESEEAMNALVFSTEGHDLMKIAGISTPCELSFFTGKEKRFSKETTDNLRQTILGLGYDNG